MLVICRKVSTSLKITYKPDLDLERIERMEKSYTPADIRWLMGEVRRLGDAVECSMLVKDVGRRKVRLVIDAPQVVRFLRVS